MRTVARIALTVVGAELLLFGTLSMAYGLFFMEVRMFAIFDPELSTMLAVVAVVNGVVLLVVARRGLWTTSMEATST